MSLKVSYKYRKAFQALNSRFDLSDFTVGSSHGVHYPADISANTLKALASSHITGEHSVVLRSSRFPKTEVTLSSFIELANRPSWFETPRARTVNDINNSISAMILERFLRQSPLSEDAFSAKINALVNEALEDHPGSVRSALSAGPGLLQASFYSLPHSRPSTIYIPNNTKAVALLLIPRFESDSLSPLWSETSVRGILSAAYMKRFTLNKLGSRIWVMDPSAFGENREFWFARSQVGFLSSIPEDVDLFANTLEMLVGNFEQAQPTDTNCLELALKAAKNL